MNLIKEQFIVRLLLLRFLQGQLRPVSRMSGDQGFYEPSLCQRTSHLAPVLASYPSFLLAPSTRFLQFLAGLVIQSTLGSLSFQFRCELVICHGHLSIRSTSSMHLMAQPSRGKLQSCCRGQRAKWKCR